MFHVTERLLLRPTWPEDWAQVLDAVADERVVMNLARAPWPYREEDARTWVNHVQDPRMPNFAVVESASGRLIGSAGLGEIDGEVEVGYWLRPDVWGRGYATEATRGLVDVARMLGHRKLVAGHFVDNPASGRVLRKAGFLPTGQIRRRFSSARQCTVDSVEHALELGESMLMPRAA